MSKLFRISLAILFIFTVAGIARATNIPQVSDPKNYPTVWTELVYNGSGSEIVSAYVVQWDFDTSDSDAGTMYDDVCPWVKTADAAGDIWTAGVVVFGKSIANGDTGEIIIRGPAVTFMGTNTGGISSATCTVNTIAESTANGFAQNHDGAAVDEGTLGVTIKASAAAVDIGGDANADFALIYVNPVQYDKD